MAAKKPNWPPTISPVLSAFRSAMDRRSKALRHHLFGWTCERFDPEDARGESWLVWFRTVNVDLSIRHWAEGEFWFYAREFEGETFRFELEFFGRIDGVEPDEMIEDLEATFLLVNVRESNPEAKAAILDRWSTYGPFGVDHGRA